MIPHFSTSNIDTPHAFFSRQGGVSTGFFSSLNCGGKADHSDLIQQNRDIIKDFFLKKYNLKESPRLVLCNQIHSADPLWIDKKIPDLLNGDALVTNQPNLLIGVLTGDCCPILLHAPKEGLIAAIHAGWKGALLGIIKNTVTLMKEKGATVINAAVGPCLGREYFEVKEDFVTYFMSFEYHEEFYIKDNLFNLSLFVIDRLKESDVYNIDHIAIDTYTNENIFFSYRRKTHRNEVYMGLQISAIMTI